MIQYKPDFELLKPRYEAYWNKDYLDGVEQLRHLDLILIPQPDEVEFLLTNLSHKGLMLSVGGIKDHEEAADLERLARKLAH